MFELSLMKYRHTCYHKGLDGQRIIIFGGKIGKPDREDEISSQDSLYALNLTDFGWYVPSITGDRPSSRYHHQANVIRNYMVITFGKYDMFLLFMLKFALKVYINLFYQFL